MDLRVVFLGTSAATPTDARGLSSIAVARGNEILLFDAGEGMQRNFVRSSLRMNSKMKVFITHMHADHSLGILGLLQTLSLNGRTLPIDIYGEPRLAEFIKFSINQIGFGLSFDINLHNIEAEGLLVRENDYEVTCCEADHHVIAYSFCLTELERPGVFNVKRAAQLGIPEGNLFKQLQSGKDIIIKGSIVRSTDVVGPRRPGRKIGISGDTRPTEKLCKFFENCDLLVFESTYGNELRHKAIENYHATATEAATLARQSGVRKLVLTHFSTRYRQSNQLLAEARLIHEDVDEASDLKIIDLPYRQ
ncbi:MAG TPA: ribonuclease Z [Nitrososphaeraceae archaeon]|jgi:ribonuclease Z|nr:ribonuclease Z [Nitrososphaeraceae archaeon]